MTDPRNKRQKRPGDTDADREPEVGVELIKDLEVTDEADDIQGGACPGPQVASTPTRQN